MAGPIAFLVPDPIQSTQLIPGGNTPASGGLLFVYQVGSTTKSNSYTDPSASTARTNPIVLDSGGNIPGNGEVWITSTAKFVLAPSNDTDPPSSPYWSKDNYPGINNITAAQVQALSAQSEWVQGSTATFVGVTGFSVVGDQTALYTTGRRVKATVTGGDRFGIVTSAVLSTGSTAVGVTLDSGTLNGGLSAVSYGILSTPNGSVPWTIETSTGLQILGTVSTGTLSASAVSTVPLTASSVATSLLTATTGTITALSVLTSLNLSSSTAGQISFPAAQNPSGGANILDDYQEGAPLASLSLKFNGSSTGWSFLQASKYVKIGRQVFFYYSIVTTKGAATGSCTLEGLPFTADTTLSGGGPITKWLNMGTTFTYLSADVVPSSTSANLFGASTASASMIQLSDTSFQTSSQIVGLVSYRAAN